jgi:hypothetical protein
MALVKGENVARSVPRREHYKGCISQADPKAGEPPDDLACGLYIRGAEGLELVGASSDFFQQCGLRGSSDMLCEKVVQFRQHERREQQRRSGPL